MNIRDVMTPNPRTVSPDDSIQSAAQIMRDEDTGAIPVVEDGRPIGLVTDRDIVVRAVADGGEFDRPVREIATTNIVAVTPDMSAREANDLMREHQIRRLPVVEGERLVGMVSLGDLAVKESKETRMGETLERVSEGVKEQERY
jgi:CBS domain-containing protein